MSKITIKAKYAIEVQPFQSTEETRYYLNGFYVDRNPSGGLRIVATDGHRLVCFHDESGSMEGEGQIVQLDKAALSAIKGAVKSSGGDAILVIEGTGENAKGSTARLVWGDTLATFNGVMIKGTFPAYEKVIHTSYDTHGAEPHLYEKTAPFSFDARYLADFGKLAINPDSRDKKQAIEVVRVQDHRSPHLVIIPGRPDVFGVLMPTTGAGNQGAPEWYMAPAPAPKPAKASKLEAATEAALAQLGS